MQFKMKIFTFLPKHFRKQILQTPKNFRAENLMEKYHNIISHYVNNCNNRYTECKSQFNMFCSLSKQRKKFKVSKYYEYKQMNLD